MAKAASRPERRSYLVGFALALALTAVSFGLVAFEVMGRGASLIAIAVAAVAQIVVHLRFFLHLDLSASKREDLQLVLFATLLIGLMIGGSLWIMYDLHLRMMPS